MQCLYICELGELQSTSVLILDVDTIFALQTLASFIASFRSAQVLAILDAHFAVYCRSLTTEESRQAKVVENDRSTQAVNFYFIQIITNASAEPR